MSEIRLGTETSTAVATDAGMLALWDPERFSRIVDYFSWELELLEDQDLLRHISAGALVPINIGSDGAWRVLVKTGTGGQHAGLTNREAAYLVVSSEPYLLVSTGSVRLSGLETVGAEVRHGTVEFALPADRYAVTLHLIDWSSETGSLDDNGKPAPHALADFVALINPETEKPCPYRVRVESFARPSD